MRARTLTTTIAGVSLAAAVAFGLAACSSTSSTSQTSASAVAGSPAGATGDPTAMCQQIVDQKLTLEAANALAESGGNTTRVIKKDGEDLPATTDLNETRLNFEVNADVVTACTVG